MPYFRWPWHFKIYMYIFKTDVKYLELINTIMLLMLLLSAIFTIAIIFSKYYCSDEGFDFSMLISARPSYITEFTISDMMRSIYIFFIITNMLHTICLLLIIPFALTCMR